MTAALMILATGLLFVATYLLSIRRYMWDAVLWLVASLLLWIWAFARRPREGHRWPSRRWLPATRGGWMLAAALALSLLVALTARLAPQDSDFTLYLSVWLAAVALACAVFVIRLAKHPAPLLPLSRREWLGLVALLAGALLVRIVAVGRVPFNLGGDEGTQLLASLELVGKPLGNPFATAWLSVPTMSFFVYGVALRVFGATVAGGRALSALAGVAAVASTFLLGRTLGGKRVGWVASAVMAFAAYHIHYSRIASNQIFDPLIGVLTFWLITRALAPRRCEESQAAAWWGLAGMAAGLGWYAYFGARWVTFLALLYVVWRVLRDPLLLRQHRTGLLQCAAGWLIVILPLLGWYTAHPSAFTERYNAVGVFSSGWMAREIEMTGKTTLRLLFEQFYESVTAFHYTPDPVAWYGPQRPLLDAVTGGLMLVGMLAAFRRWRWPGRSLTLLWFWSTLVMAWVLTENPPSSQRGLLMMPAVALLVAWAVEAIAEALPQGRRLLSYLVFLVLAVSVAYNLTFYFAVYSPRRTYGNPTSEIATELARFMETHPEPVCPALHAAQCDGRVLFMGSPQMYWDFGALAFLLRDIPGEDVPADTLPEGVAGPVRFVLVYDRIKQLEPLTAWYPGGALTRLESPGGRLLAVIYDWQ